MRRGRFAWGAVYPGRRSFLAWPGLLSCHPYGISVWLAALEEDERWCSGTARPELPIWNSDVIAQLPEAALFGSRRRKKVELLIMLVYQLPCTDDRHNRDVIGGRVAEIIPVLRKNVPARLDGQFLGPPHINTSV